MSVHPAEALPEPPPLELAATALFLDLDGTIAPISDSPSKVGPTVRRTRLLRGLKARLDGRLAVLSGRTLEDVDRILDGAVDRVAAVHGLVRRDGKVELRAAANLSGLERARRSLASLGRAYEGVVVEDKTLSLAVHYRLAPTLETPLKAHLREVSRQTGLVLQPGSCVLELRAPGPTKGDSLSEFMTSAPFAGFSPVMLGDDLTDESAFEAAAALGGYGVLVGAMRPTSARHRLTDVEAVLAWLRSASG